MADTTYGYGNSAAVEAGQDPNVPTTGGVQDPEKQGNRDAGSESDDISPPYLGPPGKRTSLVPGVTDPHQNVFTQGGGKSYRTVGRWGSGLILITNQVGIGILSLPYGLRVLGIVPGVIAIVGIGLLSTYTAYELLQFYRKHPYVVNVVDMGRVVGGPILEVIVAIGLLINFLFTCASITVTVTTALNSISDHGMCTVGFMAVSVVCFWLLCLPRSFGFVAKVGIPCAISILAACLIVMISLGVENPAAVESDDWSPTINVVGNPSLREGITACLNIAYAYAGNGGFVSYMAEMKDPSRDFVPALFILQGFAIPLYVTVAVAIYCLAGEHTDSPSLGSAPLVPAKVAYGIALPCLLGTALVFGHTVIKYVYVAVMRWMKATDQITANSVKSWITWVSCNTLIWVLAFILANAIPTFPSILAISSSTTIAWFTFGISAVFWFNLNWGKKMFSSWRKISLVFVNLFVIGVALFMNGAGTWAAIDELLEIFANDSNEIRGPFSCANNADF